LFIIIVFPLKKILKKEDLQNSKNDKKFNNNDQPDSSSPKGHIFKTFIIKSEQTAYKRK
jgi:hypothetical protein